MSEGNGKCTGSIKWFSESKGYGFILMDDGSRDVFLHSNELKLGGIDRVLREGERVSFTLDNRPKGPFAKNVSLIGGQQ